ncbi:phosphotransferase [Nesterenkonia flava]|uniref:Aminoglycoside phosphotransferase family protein n=1 Tax=Nesterenkonia flava TaxID=469799 RepID=A0ABU1FRK7_9MICC|nr:phosphotransferase [Nesterenkonia flava]MDR5711298.1 aminoglycoside phosphotransferase family protein [Nesterenkonia flava]
MRLQPPSPRAAPTRDVTHRETQHLGFLESPAASASLTAALDSQGITASDVQLETIQHRPGAGVTGIYRVSSAASPEELYVGMTTEVVPAEAEGVTLLPLPGGDPTFGALALWHHPFDPALPGLPLATDPGSVARTWGLGRQLVALETVSYRPLRRAVIAADFSDGSRLYLKVLRGGQASELDARHRLLLDAGVQAPRPVREPIADVVGLEQGEGVSLAEYFLADGASAVDPQDFISLLDRLPAEVMTLPARDAWTDRLPAYASAAVSALPEDESRIRRLEAEILAGLEVSDRGPVVPTHGDFYEANVLMHQAQISCLLDVDSLGPGHRVDDLACFLGHLAVLPAVDQRYVYAPAAFTRFAQAFAATVDPTGLRVRSASVALSLVAGARDARRSGWQAQAEHRLRCAEALLGLTAAEADLPQWPAGL